MGPFEGAEQARACRRTATGKTRYHRPWLTMAERLHLDLTSGARADMIAGALVAVGAPMAAAQQALACVGLARVLLVSERVARGGLAAVHCRLLLDGTDLGGAPAGKLDSGRPRSGPRRRHPTPKPRRQSAQRAGASSSAATVAGVQGPQGIAGVVDDRTHVLHATERARPPAPRGVPAAPNKWLEGGEARAADLVDVIRAAPLPTVVKALALKAARRLLDALQTVAATRTTRLQGARAARILADLVVGAALIDALAPSLITASPVGLSTTASDDEGLSIGDGTSQSARGPSPSPWLLEVLAGVPVLESDDPVPVADLAGAALAWSIVSRFGARGLASSSKQGCGASAVEAAGRAVVVRALLGPAAALATRAGSKEIGTAVVVSALLPLASLAGLQDAARGLLFAGASDVELCQVDVLGAGRAVRVRVLVSAADVDSATTTLWRAGALEVVAGWVERRKAGVQEVTVAIGRGKAKSSVRVRVLSDGAEILRVDPDTGDVGEAAARARMDVHTIAAEAIAAWQRLHTGRADGPLPRRPK